MPCRRSTSSVAGRCFANSTTQASSTPLEGASQLAEWEQLSVKALTEQVLEAGTATAEQIDAHVARLADPSYRGHGWAWIGARGQRSAAAGVNWSDELAAAA